MIPSRIPRPVLTRRRKIFMVMVVVVAAVALITLKLTAARDNNEIAQNAAVVKETALEKEARAGKMLVKFHQGISDNGKQMELLTRVAEAFTTKSAAKNSPVKLKFYLLNEPNQLNVYALSTGEIYITTALFNRMQTEGQLAAALAQGLAHVMQGDHLAPDEKAAHWVYPAAAEPKADATALSLMTQAGYDPNAMISMFKILVDAYGAGADVGFFTTHPNSEGRLEAIQAEIQRLYPDGVPAVMSK